MGWKARLFAEIDKFPSLVLAHHYPEVKNVGDFTKITKDDCGSIDVLVAGTPCQDFSVAGLRAGLDGARGQLTIEYARLAHRLRARWLVWENVPGVLSIDGGRAFGTFLGLLGQLGYGIAYRILDAQYLGVPQRRRRVFVVGYLGDWRRSAAVLFERQSLSGDTPPRRKTGEGFTYDVAPCLASSGRGFDRPGDLRGQDCLIAHTLRGTGFDASEDGTGRGIPLIAQTLTADMYRSGGATGGFNPGVRNVFPVSIAPTLLAAGNNTGGNSFYGTNIDTCESLLPIAIQERAVSENPEAGPDGSGIRTDGISYTLEARTVPQAVMTPGMAVRRLTPRECERLQGFPDDYTLISPKTADGPRYKALGNSMAVPVMRWIGERIAMVDAL